MKILIIVVFICITNTVAYAQQSFIRWNQNQQLQWDDFTGKVNDSSRFDAESFAEVCYQYKFYNAQDFEFEVYAHFDKNASWSRKEKQCEALLRHEQIHFNIAQLFAEKLKNDFRDFSYTKDFDAEVVQLFNRKKLEYQQMQRQYDEETNHSLNKEKQKEWEDFIGNELSNTRLKLQLAQSIKKDTQEDSRVSLLVNSR